MTAGIDFRIYKNFGKYIKDDYSDALKALNEMLYKLVKKNKLTFLYKHKRVKIILPIKLSDCGNIFSEKYDGADYWDVSIRCEIDCEYENFDWTKLDVGACPNGFEPLGRFVG